jgi:hypothetical protein
MLPGSRIALSVFYTPVLYLGQGRCKPPTESYQMPYLPAGLPYLLVHAFTRKYPPSSCS